MLSAEEREGKTLRAALDAVDEILGYISQLDKAASRAELERILPGLLASMGEYSQSDRSYVFEWRDGERRVLHMTHEWCAPGVRPTIGEMQDVHISDMPHWSVRLRNGEPIVSMDWDGEKAVSPEEFALFDGQNIHALIVIPIFSGKALNGYIGFDNPDQGTSALSLRLLSSVGGHLGSLRENLNMMEELAEKHRTLQRSLDELGREKNVLEALSIDYTSVYYCDLLADTMEPLKQGTDTNAAVTDSELTEGKQSFSFRIQYYYENFVVQDSAPDFLYKMSAGFLRVHLAHNERFAYRFRTHPNPAGQQFFEVQVVRLKKAPGFKVVMGYRYIDDIVAEQERQHTRLAGALAEANLNNEIINSISKIYWLIYRIDLVTGAYEEVSAGQEMHRLTGRQGNAAEVFREVLENVVSPEHRRDMTRFLDTATLPERLRETESVALEYHAANGSWHLARFIVKKRNAAGDVTNVLYVVREIDKQKQQELEYRAKMVAAAEDARRANLAKTDFLRRMSHDIRTPINGIRGVIAIANHFPQDLAKQQECRDKVYQASGYLLELVNSVLDMNKLESGTVELEHKPFDLLELLRDTLNIIEMQGQEQGITMNVKALRVQHRRLMGSPLHFKQVIQNVAGNAVKYNKPGGSITVSCEEMPGEPGRAAFRLTCADTGRGMSREFLAHAFEPFSQEDFDARTAYMGTGLGLAITKQLTEMMGGAIRLESELNVGTRVTVDISFDIDESSTAQPVQADPADRARLDGVRVLLVEDNELNMEIAKFMLEQAGAAVLPAWNGKEAVSAFAARWDEVDVILMDVMMPVMDGLKAARAIRAMDRPNAASVPIFAMTANAFQDDVRRSLAAGMNEHLAKPLQEGEVLAAIRRYVRPREKKEEKT